MSLSSFGHTACSTSYEGLQALPEASLIDFARLAAGICATEITTVYFVALDRQYFQASIGWRSLSDSTTELPHSPIDLAADIVPDFVRLPGNLAGIRLLTQALVQQNSSVQFCIGIPLQLATGKLVGKLYVTDPPPQLLYSQQIALLQVLGRQIGQQIDLQQQANQQSQGQLRRLIEDTERERLMTGIAQRIRQSLNLEEILNTTVEEVRQFLQSDRVLIYRFNPDWSGVVVVESVAAGWLSTLDMVIKDPCLEGIYTNLYQQGRIWLVENADTAGLNPCHLELLNQLQAVASLVVPILQNDQVWGLLVVHQCRGIRHWQTFEVNLLQQLAMQVAIAIQQSELYQQVQRLNADLEHQVWERTNQLQQAVNFAAVLKRITDKIRDSLDEQQILQTAVQELVHILKVDYCGALLYNSTYTAATVSTDHSSAHLGSAVGQILQIADCTNVHTQLFHGNYFEFYENSRSQYFHSRDSGDLACPDLFQKFAAKLLYPIFLCSVSLQKHEQGVIGYLAVIDQVEHTFSKTEIHLIQQVANQCAIAIRQARLYQAAQLQVAELEKLNRLKDDFLSTVSHELRTPITNMKIAMQMLAIAINQERLSHPATDAAKPEINKTTHYLQILQDECRREISLINDLLDLQRLEAGTQPLELETLHLQTWLTTLIKPFRERTENRQQVLQTNFATDLPPIQCDRFALERILNELIHNACKYSPPSGQIIVSAQTDSHCVLLSVTNSGVEIASEEQLRIFDKFYRIPSADPWKQGGTGLGLALVKRLIHHLGASIQVSSTAGQTCFTVRLPQLRSAEG